MIRSLSKVVCSVILGLAWVGAAHAGAPAKEVVRPAPVDWFQTGRFELQILSGPLLSLQATHDARPNIDYALTVARLGYMLDTPRGHGFFRGNDEVLLETNGAYIFQGPGTGIGGASILYRRNFVQPNCPFAPYFGISLGGVYTDIYHNRTERSIGSNWNFNLGAHVGIRYQLNHGPWSIDAEAAYRHISDAGITNRNDGIDAVGGLIGFSRFF